MNIVNDISRLGGLAATHELLAAGYSQRGLGRAAAAGIILRVRQGWYCLPERDEASVQAVRVGGRLSCISGAEHYSLWVKGDLSLHVDVSPRSSRLRTRHDKRVRLSNIHPTATVVHWSDTDDEGTRFALTPRECLRQMAFCRPPDEVVAAADSALRFGMLSLQEWKADTQSVPSRLSSSLVRVNPKSESIIESITRFRLQERGIEPRIQMAIAGVGRVDLVLGERLVIELDGWEYHSDRERFEADRRRDARLSTRGYRVLRFSYRQVMERWFEVRSAILSALARGDHLA